MFFAATSTSSFGNVLTSIALAFAVLDVTGSVAALGLTLAATRLPHAVFLLLGGVIGDRLPRRTVMLGSDALRCGSQGVAALLLLSHEAELWHLLVLFAIHGLAAAFFEPAAAGLLPEIVEKDDLQRANAVLGTSRGAIGLLGMPIGGVLVASVGPGGALAIDSVSFLLSAGALAFIRVHTPGTLDLSQPLLRDLRNGWREFSKHTWLWAGTLHISLLNAFPLVAFFTLGPAVAERSLGGATTWGVIGAAFAAGTILGGAVAFRWTPSRPLFVAFVAVFAAAPQLALLGLAAPRWLIAAGSFLGGAQATFWGSIWAAFIQRSIAGDMLSRVTSYDSLGSLVLTPLGYATVGVGAPRPEPHSCYG